MKQGQKRKAKSQPEYRGPGQHSITFSGITLWEAQELLERMRVLDAIRPIRRKGGK